MEQVIGNKRAQIVSTVERGEDPMQFVNDLVTLDVPLDQKFAVLHFSQLLHHNGQSGDTLKKLIMGLNILEKYGRHLLKPAGQRSNMWRCIKYSNSIFRDRVDTIRGGREIIRQMGYTSGIDDGVEFPEGAEPDQRTIKQLVADILLGKKEIEAYLTNTHPHGHLVTQCINYGSQAGRQSTQSAGFSGQDISTGPPVQPPDSQSQPMNPPSISRDELMSTKPEEAAACDICGEKSPEVICTICDSKQLCAGCDEKWHNHRMRRNHARQRVGGQEVSRNDSEEQGSVYGTVVNQMEAVGTRQGPPHASSGDFVSYGQQSNIQRVEPQRLPFNVQQNLQMPSSNISSISKTSSKDSFYTAPEMVQAGQAGNRTSISPTLRGQKFGENQTTSQQQSAAIRPIQYSQTSANQITDENTGTSPSQVRAPVTSYQSSFQYPPFTCMSNTGIPVGAVEPTLSVGAHPTSSRSPVFPPVTGSGVPTSQWQQRLSDSGSQSSMSPGPNQQNQVPFFRGEQYGYMDPQSLQSPSSKLPEMSITSSQSKSKLLPRIQSIPDLHKQRAKIDISILTLDEDIQEYDKQLNAIIVNDPEFYASKEYIDISRKKGNLLREKVELEKYGQQLDEVNTFQMKDQHGGYPHSFYPAQPGLMSYQPGPGMKMNVVGADQHAQPTTMPTTLPAYPQMTPGYQVAYPPFHGHNTAGGGQGLSMQVNQPHGQQVAYRQMKKPHDQELANQAQFKPQSPPPEGSQAKSAGVDANQNTRIPGLLPSDAKVGQVAGNVPGSGMVNKMNIPVGTETAKQLKQNTQQNTVSTQSQVQRRSGNFVQSDKINKQEVVGTETREIGEILTQLKLATSEKISNLNVDQTKHSETSKPVEKMKQTHSSPNFIEDEKEKNKMSVSKSFSVPTSSEGVWECEHCTFINSNDTHICGMCYKTSSIKPSPPPPQSSSSKPSRTPPPRPPQPRIAAVPENVTRARSCPKCTYENEEGSMFCTMCEVALPEIALKETATEYTPKTQEAKLSSGSSEGSTQGAGISEPSGGGEAGAKGGKPVGKLIDEEQDKVYFEKKAAQRKYQEMMQEGHSSGAQWGSKQPEVVEAARPEIPQGASASPIKQKYVDELKKEDDQLSSSNSGTYSSAHSSLEPTPTTQTTVPKPKPHLPENFAQAIELINEKRAIEQMSVDGRDLISLIKHAENDGFEVHELEIAMTKSLEDRSQPLAWLRQKWKPSILEIVSLATRAGSESEQNDVGKVTEYEARKALQKCEGDVTVAVEKCVQNRRKKFREIQETGPYAREEILEALHESKGRKQKALNHLNQTLIQPFIDRLWTEGMPGEDSILLEMGTTPGAVGASAGADSNSSMANSVINHEDFLRMIKNKDINTDRRIRMVLVESRLQSWGRAETVIRIVDTELENLNCTLEDVIEAVRNCGDRMSSLVYLQQECGCCFAIYPMSKIRSLGTCQCKICQECVKQNFEVVIKDNFVRNWHCPLCSQPDIENNVAAAEYFGFLQLLLQTLVDQEMMDLFDMKLRDWHLQKDPKFRWCAHCANGFMWAPGENNLGMTCPYCKKKTCFSCKKVWEPQHEGLTCEQFSQWKIDNDPELQAQGLARHLEENGIDCPSCKMRYSLAKGGCMHFKCPQCGHEFCSGCSQAFHQAGTCTRLKSCRTKGLHCHHPRDCFYYLRDEDVKDLKKLLKDNNVAYNAAIPAGQEAVTHCPVMEQKEFGMEKRDEACGNPVVEEHAGICVMHYKEYLVGLINKNKIDPVAIMPTKALQILIERNERELPKVIKNEQEQQYRKRLIQFIKEKFPLKR